SNNEALSVLLCPFFKAWGNVRLHSPVKKLILRRQRHHAQSSLSHQRESVKSYLRGLSHASQFPLACRRLHHLRYTSTISLTSLPHLRDNQYIAQARCSRLFITPLFQRFYL